jgi:hypothetical protein
MTESNNAEFQIRDAQLGDVVDLGFSDGIYGVGTVTRVTDEEVIVTRPYLHTSDFSCSSGVIPYLGWEECRYLKMDRRDFPIRLLRRRDDIR